MTRKMNRSQQNNTVDLILAVGVVIGFAGLLKALGLVQRAHEVNTRAKECMRVFRDPDLKDRQKENALQEQSKQLGKLLFILAGGSLLAIGVPMAGVWLLEQLGLSSVSAVWNVLEHPNFLLSTFIAGTLLWIGGRYWQSREST